MRYSGWLILCFLVGAAATGGMTVPTNWNIIEAFLAGAIGMCLIIPSGRSLQHSIARELATVTAEIRRRGWKGADFLLVAQQTLSWALEPERIETPSVYCSKLHAHGTELYYRE